jgi:hypothetical protein
LVIFFFLLSFSKYFTALILREVIYMKLIKYLPTILLLVVCTVVSIACSNGKSPVTPATEDTSGISSDIPVSLGISGDSRNLLAVYDAVIDPAAKTFTFSPAERSAQYHFPLTKLYPNVLKITGYGWTPNFWADIKLAHPYPGSGIKGYDPRVIAILPANAGVRFIYPALGVGGNNAVVLRPDGYTKLFDELGGTMLGNVNPFKAYFKHKLGTATYFLSLINRGFTKREILRVVPDSQSSLM